MGEKAGWEGEILAVQPRIRLNRSFDQRSHTYRGYVLRVRGTWDGKDGVFVVAIGKAAQAKHAFRAGDVVTGKGLPVADTRQETADLYKVSGLKRLAWGPESPPDAPPFLGVPPTLEVYRERNHRRLASPTFQTTCRNCIWGCAMAVEMTLDHWNPALKEYRRETFCYGPKSCRLYEAGPTRTVPGRNGMSWEEEDWVDEEATAHRGPDD
ncbi:MAG TPA: hypothetical protein ENK43_01330 [Planctomycetes bacterium]|nr:hypothetical protein [Planctomycetota bacterium]